MTHQEAVKLIKSKVITSGSTWADLGAGRGTFTYALADLIGSEGTVYAIDQQEFNLSPFPNGAQIITQKENFIEGIGLENLDGILMANSLHYVEDKSSFLIKILKSLNKIGAFILIEYDTMQGNTWVPFPISLDGFNKLAKEVGLSEPVEIGRMASRYGNGGMYAAVCKTTN